MKDNYRSMMENITLSPAARTFIDLTKEFYSRFDRPLF